MEIKENLTRYVESASIDNKLIVQAASNELKESLSKCTVRLKESIDTSEGWWVPISFYGKKNGNGRIYKRGNLGHIRFFHPAGGDGRRAQA